MGLLDVAKAPILNDVATDLDDPPTYVRSRHGPIPESWKPRIRSAYPFLKPLLVTLSHGGGQQMAEVVAAVMDAATSLARNTPRWEVVAVQTHDEAASSSSSGAGGGVGGAVVGVLEAVSTTRLMRFKDDLVMRLKLVEPQAAWAGATGPGTTILRVDVRSASRVGKGDLGTNAARIRDFLGRLREQLIQRDIHII
ncbi:hypothetical protein HYH02_013274 [Chlamydomonas schloesseri]|uniref:DUF1499 domain-containing protein n=1 Tax=Chlamydomonas schloesseri TaxID=2026947 RepID=A0A835VW89_9CHLO|nr:hypothetical protein HYH02_013274 [Chlamydomonas schloesseri]|eukprot:KAG2431697.1 hypothetical protein HYH02_013274 [Chlamydomonas schloesseri]